VADLSTKRLEALIATSTPGRWTATAGQHTLRGSWLICVPVDRGLSTPADILAATQRFGAHTEEARANAALMAASRDVTREVLRLRTAIVNARATLPSWVNYDPAQVYTLNARVSEADSILLDAITHSEVPRG